VNPAIIVLRRDVVNSVSLIVLVQIASTERAPIVVHFLQAG
jgi:hypothetical protein